MTTEIIVMIVGLCASISGIIFAFVGYRRNERADSKNAGKNQGVLAADISYIKSSVDRVERNVVNIDERYHNLAERLAKVEENLSNIQKQIEELKK